MNGVLAGLAVCGCVLVGWVAREIIGGLRDGWTKSGKSFREEVRDRVNQRRGI